MILIGFLLICVIFGFYIIFHNNYKEQLQTDNESFYLGKEQHTKFFNKYNFREHRLNIWENTEINHKVVYYIQTGKWSLIRYSYNKSKTSTFEYPILDNVEVTEIYNWFDKFDLEMKKIQIEKKKEKLARDFL